MAALVKVACGDEVERVAVTGLELREVNGTKCVSENLLEVGTYNGEPRPMMNSNWGCVSLEHGNTLIYCVHKEKQPTLLKNLKADGFRETSTFPPDYRSCAVGRVDMGQPEMGV